MVIVSKYLGNATQTCFLVAEGRRNRGEGFDGLNWEWSQSLYRSIQTRSFWGRTQNLWLGLSLPERIRHAALWRTSLQQGHQRIQKPGVKEVGEALYKWQRVPHSPHVSCCLLFLTLVCKRSYQKVFCWGNEAVRQKNPNPVRQAEIRYAILVGP